ncbi:uncharacterized protein LOC121728310 [Aricia agestis]|uniref:uncharacterized protein LOC121728310 n=1 Tax=Aricia agestis TaxID=91739 RepID=UPI001C2074C6|nr:uncharacterized protein LOC121728310 [Aricia agestis]
MHLLKICPAAAAVGHHNICVVSCGLSIVIANRCRILIEGTNEEQQRVASIVSSWIQAREMSSMNEVSGVCWNQARDIRSDIPEADERSQQNIVLFNIRRAAETPGHCVFQECMNPEQNVVPRVACACVVLLCFKLKKVLPFNCQQNKFFQKEKLILYLL